MSFHTDKETFRTVDRERGLVLESTTGGSDGRQGQALTGPDFRTTFDVYQSMRDANPVERAARPTIAKTIVYHLSNAGPPIPGMTLRQTYELLGEAMLARRLSERDDEVNWAVLYQSIASDV